MLQHCADTPTAYYNFQVLSSVTVNFLNGDANNSFFQIITCIFPQNWMLTTIHYSVRVMCHSNITVGS
jgi:hypothetical protein